MMTLVLALVPFRGISAKKKTIQQSDRQYWCSLAYKMAQPVLENMAKGELQKNMQTEFSPSFDNRETSAGLSRSGRLNGSVQGKQIGLSRNIQYLGCHFIDFA